MDLGLKGKWALVCGASKGLGYACASSLAQEGVNLVIAARTRQALNESRDRIAAESGVEVIAVDADVTTDDGRQRAVQAAPHGLWSLISP